MKFIRIQSTRNIEVTPGLLSIDMTNPDAHVPDRFKVATGGTSGMRVLLKEGTHYYPACIKGWSVMPALARDKIITIGEEVDATDEADAKAIYDRLITNAKKFKSMTKGASVSKDDLKTINAIIDAEGTGEDKQ